MDKQKADSSGPTVSDIFSMLVETGQKEKQKRRQELLAPLGLRNFLLMEG